MGWSLGSAVALSVISHLDTYPQSVQARLGAYLRTLILHGKCVRTHWRPAQWKTKRTYSDSL